MKKHYLEKDCKWTACGLMDGNVKTTSDIDHFKEDPNACKRCLKSLQPPKPKKCWVNIKGTDQSLDFTCYDRTAGQLIERLLIFLTDEALQKEMKKRATKKEEEHKKDIQNEIPLLLPLEKQLQEKNLIR